MTLEEYRERRDELSQELLGLIRDFEEAKNILTDYVLGTYQGQELDLSDAKPPDHVT